MGWRGRGRTHLGHGVFLAALKVFPDAANVLEERKSHAVCL